MFPYRYGYSDSPQCPHSWVRVPTGPSPQCPHHRRQAPSGPISEVHFYNDFFYSALPGLPSAHTVSMARLARDTPIVGTWVMVSEASLDDNGTWTIGLMWPSAPIVLVGNLWDHPRIVGNPVCCRARVDCGCSMEPPSETPDGSPTGRWRHPWSHPQAQQPPPPPPTEPPPEGVRSPDEPPPEGVRSPDELSKSRLPADELIL